MYLLVHVSLFSSYVDMAGKFQISGTKIIQKFTLKYNSLRTHFEARVSLVFLRQYLMWIISKLTKLE